MKSRDSIDILGIGLGPSNLAFAVAFEESHEAIRQLKVVFTERNENIVWHPGLLLPWSVSQVSFVKDLVTLRNPRSKFTFLNFLKSVGRLDAFVNLGTFTPYRTEISEYFSWVEQNLEFSDRVFNRECVDIEPIVESGRVSRWTAHYSDGTAITARDIVFSSGRDLSVPGVFAELSRDRVFHSQNYLRRIREFSKKSNLQVAVVGSAQSAAEVFRSIHDDLEDCNPTLIMRSIGLRQYETSPFRNELYYPSAVDEFFEMSKAARETIVREMHYTNYGGVAPYLLDGLYRLLYQQRLHSKQQSRILAAVEVVEAKDYGRKILLSLKNRLTGDVHSESFDLVILATGFRNAKPKLLKALDDYIQPGDSGDIPTLRDYRIAMRPHVDAGFYVQGLSEKTHGISDSLLSILASRSQVILGSIRQRRTEDYSRNLAEAEQL